jgi:hypothetical protein
MNTEKFIINTNEYDYIDVDLYFETDAIKDRIVKFWKYDDQSPIKLTDKNKINNYSKVDVDQIHADDFDIDQVNASARIEWMFDIEMRSWGVKSFSAYATAIKITVFVNYYYEGDDPNDYIEHEDEMVLDLNEFELESQREGNDYSGNTKDHICVNNVSVDFQDKTIQITF